MAVRWLRTTNYWRLAIPFAVGLILAVLARLPVERLDTLPSLCLIKAITGRECAGCGMTHAASALLHGDVSSALQYNWRIMIVAPILLWVFWRSIIDRPYNKTQFPA